MASWGGRHPLSHVLNGPMCTAQAALCHQFGSPFRPEIQMPKLGRDCRAAQYLYSSHRTCSFSKDRYEQHSYWRTWTLARLTPEHPRGWTSLTSAPRTRRVGLPTRTNVELHGSHGITRVLEGIHSTKTANRFGIQDVVTSLPGRGEAMDETGIEV